MVGWGFKLTQSGPQPILILLQKLMLAMSAIWNVCRVVYSLTICYNCLLTIHKCLHSQRCLPCFFSNCSSMESTACRENPIAIAVLQIVRRKQFFRSPHLTAFVIPLFFFTNWRDVFLVAPSPSSKKLGKVIFKLVSV